MQREELVQAIVTGMNIAKQKNIDENQENAWLDYTRYLLSLHENKRFLADFLSVISYAKLFQTKIDNRMKVYLRYLIEIETVY